MTLTKRGGWLAGWAQSHGTRGQDKRRATRRMQRASRARQRVPVPFVSRRKTPAGRRGWGRPQRKGTGRNVNKRRLEAKPRGTAGAQQATAAGYDKPEHCRGAIGRAAEDKACWAKMIENGGQGREDRGEGRGRRKKTASAPLALVTVTMGAGREHATTVCLVCVCALCVRARVCVVKVEEEAQDEK